MRAVSFSGQESVRRVFPDSAYENAHLGWLDVWQIEQNGGRVFLDEEIPGGVLIGLQPANHDTLWLHSFFSKQNPTDYDVSGSLKKCLADGIYSIYTISSHNWYSALLMRNGFRPCDEIIQLETNRITIPAHVFPSDQNPIDMSDFDSIRKNCECSFPPLWRLRKTEFEAAFQDADYKMRIGYGEDIRGYLLAAVDPDNCHILRLAVNPEYQHQGIASGLISRMISECEKKGIRNFSVNTNKKNSAAVNLYHSLNFLQSGRTYPVFYKRIYVKH